MLLQLRLLTATAPIATLTRSELKLTLEHAAHMFDDADASPVAGSAPVPPAGVPGGAESGAEAGGGRVDSSEEGGDATGRVAATMPRRPAPLAPDLSAVAACKLLVAAAAGLLVRAHRHQHRWEKRAAAPVGGAGGADDRFALVTEHVGVASLLASAARAILQESYAGGDARPADGEPEADAPRTGGSEEQSTGRAALSSAAGGGGDEAGVWEGEFDGYESDGAASDVEAEHFREFTQVDADGVIGSASHQQRMHALLVEFGASAAAALSVVRDFPTDVLRDFADVLAPALEAAEHAGDLRPVALPDGGAQKPGRRLRSARARELAAAAEEQGLRVTKLKVSPGVGVGDVVVPRVVAILEPAGGPSTHPRPGSAAEVVGAWAHDSDSPAALFVVLAEGGDLVSNCMQPGPTPGLRLLQHQMFEAGSPAAGLPSIVLDGRSWQGLPAELRGVGLRSAAQAVLRKPTQRRQIEALPQWFTPVRFAAAWFTCIHVCFLCVCAGYSSPWRRLHGAKVVVRHQTRLAAMSCIF